MATVACGLVASRMHRRGRKSVKIKPKPIILERRVLPDGAALDLLVRPGEERERETNMWTDMQREGEGGEERERGDI